MDFLTEHRASRQNLLVIGQGLLSLPLTATDLDAHDHEGQRRVYAVSQGLIGVM